MSVANRSPSFETRNWKSASMRSSISTFGDVRVAQIPLNWPSTKIFQNTAKVGQAKRSLTPRRVKVAGNLHDNRATELPTGDFVFATAYWYGARGPDAATARVASITYAARVIMIQHCSTINAGTRRPRRGSG